MKTAIFLLLFSWLAAAQTPPPGISVGVNAPDPNTCDAVRAGNVYVRSGNPANSPIGAFRCTQTGALTFAWLPVDHFIGASLPATCTVGDIAYKTGVTAGQNLYGCTSANTWTQQGGSGGGSVTIAGTTNQVTATGSACTAGNSGTCTIAFATSPVLPSGTTGSTQSANDNSTKVATTAYVDRVTGSAYDCQDATGSTTAYTCTATPTFLAYSTGQIVVFVPQTTNTTTGPTLNVSTVGAKNIKASATANVTAGQLVGGTPYALEYDGTQFVLAGGGGVSTVDIYMFFDGGGTAISGSATRCREFSSGGTIQGVYIEGDQSGSITIDVLTVVHSSYTGPGSASSITAAAIPALVSAARYTDTTLTGWTPVLAANTAVCFAMSAPTTVTWAAITLKVRVTN